MTTQVQTKYWVGMLALAGCLSALAYAGPLFVGAAKTRIPEEPSAPVTPVIDSAKEPESLPPTKFTLAQVGEEFELTSNGAARWEILHALCELAHVELQSEA